MLASRKDMRKMLTYTIDGAESKDLDDAISIEKVYSTPNPSFKNKGGEDNSEASLL